MQSNLLTSLLSFNWSNLRPGTRESIDVCAARFLQGESWTSIKLPTRYGKSHTARLITLTGIYGYTDQSGDIYKPYASSALFLNHTAILRDQIVKPANWDEFIRLFQVKGVEKPAYRAFKNTPNAHSKYMRPNNEIFQAATIQLVAKNIDQFSEWVDYERHQHKLPVLVFFDECQFTSNENVWGNVVKGLTEAGAICVTLTATPSRADGSIIPSYETDFLSKQTNTFDLSKPHNDPSLIKIERYQKVESIYELKAHVDVPFREAWESGYLCKISWDDIDVPLNKIDIDGENYTESASLLSDLSKNEIESGGILRKVVTSDFFINAASEQLLKHLDSWRRLDHKCAAVIFTVNDQVGEKKNNHAKRFQEVLLQLRPNLKIEVITQASFETDGTESDEKEKKDKDRAIKVLNKWDDSDSDIIIMKQMGTVGWDSKRTKVMVNATTVRQEAAFVQVTTRPATPFNNILVCCVIQPHDAMAKALRQKWIDEEGGTITLTETELIDEFERLRKERPGQNPSSVYSVGGAIYSSYTDQDGNSESTRHVVDTLIKKYPFLANYTHAELARDLREAGLQVVADQVNNNSAGDPILDAHRTVNTLKDSIKNKAKEYVNEELKRQGMEFNNDNYGKESRQFYREVYESCKVPSGLTLGRNDDLSMLRRILTEIERRIAVQRMKKNA